jgi:LCP family protein required for cell wall assembly
MRKPLGRRNQLLDPAGESETYLHERRRSRIIGRVIVGFFAVVVLVAAGGEAAYQHVTHKILRQSVSDLITTPRPSKPSPGVTQSPNATGGGTTTVTTGPPQNILVLGVDSRLGQNSQYQTKVGPAQTEDLSDTAILVHLSGDGSHATLISIPRDSVVTIPSCDRIDSNGNVVKSASGAIEKTDPTTALFNEAIELGGPACSIATVEKLTNVYIDHYVEIDFTGVVAMSNALGGVPLTMCDAISDSHTGLNLPAGPVNLKGQQALEFVRARYGLTGGDDLHRIQRQQQFMASMARKALDSANFFDAIKLYSFLNAVASSLTTDMSNSSLISLARTYQHIKTANIVFVTVPTYPAPKGDKWYEHVYWSTDESDALFSAVRADQTLATTTTGGTNTATITVPPSQITVNVLNGTGADGQAGDVADALRAQGFRIGQIGDAPNIPVAKTTIVYGPSRSDSERTLASALGAAPVAQLNNTTDTSLTLTVGQDWKGLSTGSTSSASPVTSPAGSASASSGASSVASGTAGIPTTSATNTSCVEG